MCLEFKINRFRLFTNRATLANDNFPVIPIATLAPQNVVRLKLRDSYTPKGFVDEI